MGRWPNTQLPATPTTTSSKSSLPARRTPANSCSATSASISLPSLDLSSLEITKDSFIDPNLQSHFSDLLYKVGLQDQGQTLIYVLFEHKSFPERYVALQLLGYMVRIWEQALHQNQPLLPILPLVFYHGRHRWTIAENFRALFKTPVELEPYLPEYRYLLYDLNRYKDEELQGRRF